MTFQFHHILHIDHTNPIILTLCSNKMLLVKSLLLQGFYTSHAYQIFGSVHFVFRFNLFVIIKFANQLVITASNQTKYNPPNGELRLFLMIFTISAISLMTIIEAQSEFHPDTNQQLSFNFDLSSWEHALWQMRQPLRGAPKLLASQIAVTFSQSHLDFVLPFLFPAEHLVYRCIGEVPICQ